MTGACAARSPPPRTSLSVAAEGASNGLSFGSNASTSRRVSHARRSSRSCFRSRRVDAGPRRSAAHGSPRGDEEHRARRWTCPGRLILCAYARSASGSRRTRRTARGGFMRRRARPCRTRVPRRRRRGRPPRRTRRSPRGSRCRARTPGVLRLVSSRAGPEGIAQDRVDRLLATRGDVAGVHSGRRRARRGEAMTGILPPHGGIWRRREKQQRLGGRRARGRGGARRARRAANVEADRAEVRDDARRRRDAGPKRRVKVPRAKGSSHYQQPDEPHSCVTFGAHSRRLNISPPGPLRPSSTPPRSLPPPSHSTPALFEAAAPYPPRKTPSSSPTPRPRGTRPPRTARTRSSTPSGPPPCRFPAAGAPRRRRARRGRRPKGRAPARTSRSRGAPSSTPSS